MPPCLTKAAGRRYNILIVKYRKPGRFCQKEGRRVNKVPEAWRGPLLPMGIFFAASLCAAGLFYEAASCAATVFLLLWLVFVWRKNGVLRLPKTATALAMAVLALFFLLTALWGVDHGMALLGFVKFLPLPLFCVAAAQLDPSGRRSLLELIPPIGAVMTLASFALGQISAWRGLFFVNDRLAGFLQYPNTFALLLLLGVIVLAVREKQTVWSGLCMALLLAGIFLSGSRTTLALLVLAAVTLAAVGRGKRRWIPVGAVAALLLAAGIYAALTGDTSAVGRYLTASLSSSTLLGRLLYFRDALPVILRHPFGLGYLGYFYLQGSFQTGVYSVQNIHNELLQLLLDVGWVPTGLMLIALVKSLRPGGNGLRERMMTAFICLHCMMEFDMQFVAMGFVLILTMDAAAERTVPVRSRAVILGTGCAAAALSLYLGVANGLYYAGRYQAAASLYPGYTNAWVQLLPQAEDAERMGALAERVLRLNDSVSLAHSAKARAAYASGDFNAVIREKQRAIALSRYRLEEYLDYFDMLAVGVQLYRQAGASEDVDYCLEQLAAIPDMLAEAEAKASSLAWRIDEKPELTLPAEYASALEALLAGA